MQSPKWMMLKCIFLSETGHIQRLHIARSPSYGNQEGSELQGQRIDQ